MPESSNTSDDISVFDGLQPKTAREIAVEWLATQNYELLVLGEGTSPAIVNSLKTIRQWMSRGVRLQEIADHYHVSIPVAKLLVQAALHGE